jgi:hypothetical protein
MFKAQSLVAALLLAGAGTAHAAILDFTLTNMSGETIDAMTATVKDTAEASLANLLSAPLGNGEPASISLEAAEGVCVFDLTFAFASGRILAMPDTDLCQTDGIVVE